MYCNFTAHRPTDYTLSCRQQVEYLTKEDRLIDEEQEYYFFNNTQDHITLDEAVALIDNNKGAHNNSQSKYYMMNLSPSQNELIHIENLVEDVLDQRIFQEEKDRALAKDIAMRLYLKEYVNHSMDLYAKNFDRNITIDDLVYMAKIEHSRTYKEYDRDVKHNTFIEKQIRENPLYKLEFERQYKRNSEGKIITKGMLKEGLNYHAHIIVSRYEKNGIRKDKRSFSPMSKAKESKGLNNSSIGFNRDQFNTSLQHNFDVLFNYQRPVYEEYKYRKEISKKKNTALPNISNALKNQVSSSIKRNLREQGILPPVTIPLSLTQLQHKITVSLDQQLHLRDIQTMLKNPKHFVIHKAIEFTKKAIRGIDLDH